MRLVWPSRGHDGPIAVGWADRSARVVVGDEEFSAPMDVFDNGQTEAYPALRRIAEALAPLGGRLVGCASCAWFRFSGMSRDMSGASAGYCGLVGFRNARGVVQIDHGCGEHREVPGWPFDDAAAWDARLALGAESPRPSRAAAVEGCLLGLAIGDALAYPCEFRRRGAILEAFGPDGVTDFVALHDPRWPAIPFIAGPQHPPGTYSDDTQMTIAVAEAIVANPDADLDALMRAMGTRFVDWAGRDDNDRAPGETCLRGCQNLARGVPWRDAGVAASKGCGSAMRVAPIGLRYFRDRDRLLEVARASSLLTHGHDAAVEGAAAAALLVAMALEKAPPQAMYAALLEECAPRSPDFAACLAKLSGLLEAPPELALSSAGLGEGWTAEEAVVSALYCFARSPTDFAETVRIAANTDGDSDSIACIAGGISGAFNGAPQIPARWRASVENAGILQRLAADLDALH